jgi:hypothetical protein
MAACEHGHGEHTQAVDTLALRLYELLTGYAPDDSRCESAATDDQEKFGAESKRGGERGSKIDMSKEACGQRRNRRRYNQGGKGQGHIQSHQGSESR